MNRLRVDGSSELSVAAQTGPLAEPGPLRVDVEYGAGPAGHSYCTVTGVLTSRSCGLLREALAACRDARTLRLVVDVSAVPRIDAAGLGVLIGAACRASGAPPNGCLHLVDYAGPVTFALRRTRLVRALPPAADLSAARACVG